MTPTLSSLIDIPAFYSRYSRISGKPTNSRTDGKEFHGSCPVCFGQDRFSFWESGRFSCSLRSSGCGIHGSSPYWFLRDVAGLSHRQACDELDIDPDMLPNATQAPALPLFMTRDEPPCKKWMDSAEAFVWRAERYLWSGKCENVLSYLHSRGFVDETIKRARLGYCPGWYSDSLANWGLTPIQTDGQGEIKIPEGIVLPFFVQDKIWKLSIRRPDKQYFQVTGSSDCLFNIDSLKPGEPAMLLEGEFDALSVLQEAGDLIAPIATGGTSKGLSARWIAKLLQASIILIGFDQDENLSGDQGAKEWLNVLPQAIRWEPWAKDANDMLKQQLPIRLWVEPALHLVSIPEIEREEPALRIHPSCTCDLEPSPASPAQWPPSHSITPKKEQPKCQWHANKKAKQSDTSGFYCQKCWEERLFFQDAILKDAKALGFPNLLNIAEGKDAWEEAIQQRGHIALGEVEIVLRIKKHGLNAHLSK